MKLCISTMIKKAIIPAIALSHKTSVSLGNFHANN